MLLALTILREVVRRRTTRVASGDARPTKTAWVGPIFRPHPVLLLTADKHDSWVLRPQTPGHFPLWTNSMIAGRCTLAGALL
jgi:hypothetical protein